MADDTYRVTRSRFKAQSISGKAKDSKRKTTDKKPSKMDLRRRQRIRDNSKKNDDATKQSLENKPKGALKPLVQYSDEDSSADDEEPGKSISIKKNAALSQEEAGEKKVYKDVKSAAVPSTEQLKDSVAPEKCVESKSSLHNANNELSETKCSLITKSTIDNKSEKKAVARRSRSESESSSTSSSSSSSSSGSSCSSSTDSSNSSSGSSGSSSSTNDSCISGNDHNTSQRRRTRSLTKLERKAEHLPVRSPKKKRNAPSLNRDLQIEEIKKPQSVSPMKKSAADFENETEKLQPVTFPDINQHVKAEKMVVQKVSCVEEEFKKQLTVATAETIDYGIKTNKSYSPTVHRSESNLKKDILEDDNGQDAIKPELFDKMPHCDTSELKQSTAHESQIIHDDPVHNIDDLPHKVMSLNDEQISGQVTNEKNRTEFDKFNEINKTGQSHNLKEHIEYPLSDVKMSEYVCVVQPCAKENSSTNSSEKTEGTTKGQTGLVLSVKAAVDDNKLMENDPRRGEAVELEGTEQVNKEKDICKKTVDVDENKRIGNSDSKSVNTLPINPCDLSPISILSEELNQACKQQTSAPLDCSQVLVSKQLYEEENTKPNIVVADKSDLNIEVCVRTQKERSSNILQSDDDNETSKDSKVDFDDDKKYIKHDEKIRRSVRSREHRSRSRSRRSYSKEGQTSSHEQSDGKERRRRSKSDDKDKKSSKSKERRSRSRDRSRKSHSRDRDDDYRGNRRRRSRSRDRWRRSRSRSNGRERRRSRGRDRKDISSDRLVRKRSRDREDKSRLSDRAERKRSKSRDRDKRYRSDSRSKEESKQSHSRDRDDDYYNTSSRTRRRRSQSPSYERSRSRKYYSRSRSRSSDERYKMRSRRSRSRSSDQKHSDKSHAVKEVVKTHSLTVSLDSIPLPPTIADIPQTSSTINVRDESTISIPKDAVHDIQQVVKSEKMGAEDMEISDEELPQSSSHMNNPSTPSPVKETSSPEIKVSTSGIHTGFGAKLQTFAKKIANLNKYSPQKEKPMPKINNPTGKITFSMKGIGMRKMKSKALDVFGDDSNDSDDVKDSLPLVHVGMSPPQQDSGSDMCRTMDVVLEKKPLTQEAKKIDESISDFSTQEVTKQSRKHNWVDITSTALESEKKLNEAIPIKLDETQNIMSEKNLYKNSTTEKCGNTVMNEPIQKEIKYAACESLPLKSYEKKNIKSENLRSSSTSCKIKNTISTEQIEKGIEYSASDHAETKKNHDLVPINQSVCDNQALFDGPAPPVSNELSSPTSLSVALVSSGIPKLPDPSMMNLSGSFSPTGIFPTVTNTPVMVPPPADLMTTSYLDRRVTEIPQMVPPPVEIQLNISNTDMATDKSLEKLDSPNTQLLTDIKLGVLSKFSTAKDGGEVADCQVSSTKKDVMSFSKKQDQILFHPELHVPLSNEVEVVKIPLPADPNVKLNVSSEEMFTEPATKFDHLPSSFRISPEKLPVVKGHIVNTCDVSLRDEMSSPPPVERILPPEENLAEHLTYSDFSNYLTPTVAPQTDFANFTSDNIMDDDWQSNQYCSFESNEPEGTTPKANIQLQPPSPYYKASTLSNQPLKPVQVTEMESPGIEFKSSTALNCEDTTPKTNIEQQPPSPYYKTSTLLNQPLKPVQVTEMESPGIEFKSSTALNCKDTTPKTNIEQQPPSPYYKTSTLLNQPLTPVQVTEMVSPGVEFKSSTALNCEDTTPKTKIEQQPTSPYYKASTLSIQPLEPVQVNEMESPGIEFKSSTALNCENTTPKTKIEQQPPSPYYKASTLSIQPVQAEMGSPEIEFKSSTALNCEDTTPKTNIEQQPPSPYYKTSTLLNQPLKPVKVTEMESPGIEFKSSTALNFKIDSPQSIVKKPKVEYSSNTVLNLEVDSAQCTVQEKNLVSKNKINPVLSSEVNVCQLSETSNSVVDVNTSIAPNINLSQSPEGKRVRKKSRWGAPLAFSPSNEITTSILTVTEKSEPDVTTATNTNQNVTSGYETSTKAVMSTMADVSYQDSNLSTAVSDQDNMSKPEINDEESQNKNEISEENQPHFTGGQIEGSDDIYGNDELCCGIPERRRSSRLRSKMEKEDTENGGKADNKKTKKDAKGKRGRKPSGKNVDGDQEIKNDDIHYSIPQESVEKVDICVEDNSIKNVEVPVVNNPEKTTSISTDYTEETETKRSNDLSIKETAVQQSVSQNENNVPEKDTSPLEAELPPPTVSNITITPMFSNSQYQPEEIKKEDFTPLKPEKVKSRWRRWSEMEASAEASNTAVDKKTIDDITCTSNKKDVVGVIQEQALSCSHTGQGELSVIKEEEPLGHRELSVIKEEEPISHGELSVIKEEESLGSSINMDTDKQMPLKSEIIDVKTKVEPVRPVFDEILDNLYLSDSGVLRHSKARKEGRRMVCDCTLPSQDERDNGTMACGDDCINRMLNIECGSRCPCGDNCTNKRFQKHQYSAVKVFPTSWKGWGLEAKDPLEVGVFILEYVGEVLDYEEFHARTAVYDNAQHYYFMALNASEIIDATAKGNVSRFINHSCDPNCETQKWTVNGQLRIGFFAIKPIKEGEELTFDYQFETYGEEAQKCFCGTQKCRGVIGTTKSTPLRDVEKKRKEKKERKKKTFDDVCLEEEIEKITLLDGLRRRNHVLEFSRLMVRAENNEHRISLLKVLQSTKETACLRLFLDYHGLPLIWSWMVDISSSAVELKRQILATLKIVPINNKTVLKDSRVMSVVEKWSRQLAEGGDNKTGHETDSSEPGTPVRPREPGSVTPRQGDNGGSAPSSLPSTPTPDNYDALPHKKRKFLQRIQQQEDVSSSDSEPQDKAKQNPITQVEEKSVEAKESLEEKKESSEEKSVVTSQTGESGENENKDGVSDVENMASDLLATWGDLKEIFKIPKKKVERKKTERELDLRCHESWPDKERKRHPYESPDRLRWHDDKRRRYSDDRDKDRERSRGYDREREYDREYERDRDRRERERDRERDRDHDKERFSEESLTPKSSRFGMKVISGGHRTPKLSKQERRQQFEAQVKAADRQKQLEQEQHLQEPPPIYSNETNLTFHEHSAGSETYSQHHAGYPYYDQAAYTPTDPVVGPIPGTTPLIMQQDSSMMPASHGDVSQSTLVTIDGQTIPNTTPVQPQPQYVDQSQTPQVLYPPQPSTQQTYQQLAASTQYVSSQTASVGFPQQQQPHIMQTVAGGQLSQVYYTNPQGQFIMQQQPLPPPSVYPSQPPLTQQQVMQVEQAPLPVPTSVHSFNNRLVHQLTSSGPTTINPSRDPREPPPPPPSPPPKPKGPRLPPNWKTARDADNKVYYYHTVTRQTQWDPPTWEGEEEDDMDLGTPTHEETKRKKTTTAAADTSSEVAKRIKENFRSKMSRHIVHCLNPFRKPDCKAARVTSTDDFKHLARKMTHAVLDKELKHCRHLEDLEVNENVKAKAKDYVRKYMSRFGRDYKKSANSP